jgi:adenylate kinase
MISDELTDNKSEAGYLFDGFPRTVNQYQALQQLLSHKNLSLTAVIYLSISDGEAVKRLASRRVCNRCGRGYSILFELGRKSCDCGGDLVSRPDDNEAAIQKRLSLFHTNTQPILDLMQKDGLLITIDGEQSVERITEDIKQNLDQKLKQF